MRIFILEDEIDTVPRNAILEALKGHTLTIARTARGGRLLYAPPYDLLLLDHDMEGHYEESAHPNTGYQFLVWLMEQKLSPVPTILHSQNYRGRNNMLNILAQNRWSAMEMPFSSVYIKFLKDGYGL